MRWKDELMFAYCPVTNWARYVPHKRSCGTLARAPHAAEHLAWRGTLPIGISKIYSIRISAPGAELINSGSWNPTGAYNLPNPIVLNRLNFTTNRTVEDAIIGSGEAENFVGNATLSASNVQVESNATAEFKARNEVNAINEFHAQFGSETHIYCEVADFDCSDLADFAFQARLADTSSTEGHEEGQKQIEVFFMQPVNAVHVFPNPSSGVFTVQFIGDEHNDIAKTIMVNDLTGRQVAIVNSIDTTVKLDLTAEASGIYILTITSSALQETILNKKIILQ